MAGNSYNEEEELQKALELSRETYKEEQRRRTCESPDLLLGDPEVIARQRNYDEITALYNKPPPVHPPQMTPGSIATLPYGFRPEYSMFTNQGSRIMNTVIPLPTINPMPPPIPRHIPQSLMPVQSSIHISVPPHNPSTQVNHSPIIVPFRTCDGKLIDLDDAPAPPPVMNRVSSLGRQSPKLELVNESSKLQFDDLLALLEGSNEQKSIEISERPQISTPRKQELPCSGTLEVINYENDYSIQCRNLKNEVLRYRRSHDDPVFFIAPTVDYQTTIAESIKLVIHRDETWPSNLARAQDHIEMTYEVSNTCEDLLISVLNRFCPEEEIGKTILIEQFALKLYGVDEFLEPGFRIGNLPFIAKFLSRGKDVPLQIGQKMLPYVNFQYLSSIFETSKTSQFRFSGDTLKEKINAINERLTVMDNSKSYSITMRRDLVVKVIDLCKVCYKVQTLEINSALETILAAEVESHYRHARGELVRAIYNMVTMFCEATLTDVSLKPLALKRDSEEIKESSKVDDEFMVFIESMHNVPTSWFQKYRRFYVEVRLMYGPNPIGDMKVSDNRSLINDHGIVSVPFSSWIQMGTAIMMIPRETQLCLMIFGVWKEIPKDGTPHQFLGFTYLPVFTYEGYLRQGKALLPLRQSNRGGEIIEPWGPTPLIRDKNDALLVISTIEYQYQVHFPLTIEKEHITPQEFNNINERDRNAIWNIIDRCTGHSNIVKDDKQLLWSNRKALLNIPEALVPTLASAIDWNCLSLSNIYPLLEEWTPPPPQLALDLLLPFFQDRVVRQRAVNIIRDGSSDFLINLLPQLIESLRFELFEDSSLANFLLRRCTQDRRFATILFWELDHRAMNEDPSYSARCHLLRNLIFDLQIPNLAEEISCQKDFLSKLDKVYAAAKEVSSIQIANQTVQRMLEEINDKLMVTKLRLPINPGFLCTSIKLEDCGIFNSLTRPLKLNLIGQRINYGVIYKIGDDLRQDAIVLQLVRLMNDMWLRENLDLRMLTYRVLPTGKNKGLIELVTDCQTLREVQVAFSDRATDVFKDDTISNWIARHNPSEFNYRTAFDNFSRSCAAWCVATYVLGIGDRHNDNILISTAGHVFHIDFGKYMGDWQTAMGFNRDRVPFVLTPEMVVAINNGMKSHTDKFQNFIDNCCKAFNIVRKNCSLLLNMIRFMSCSSIPNMNVGSVEFVEKNLMLELSDAEAASFFGGMIRTSMASNFPRLNFLAHTVAQRISGTSNIQASDKFEFSFTNEIHTVAEDGRIRDVHVTNYEKWKNPTKTYMYLFKVYRVGEKLPSLIYRSFEEVEELHRALVRRFGLAALPVLDFSSGFGRSNTRQIAAQRKIMLEHFFIRFLQLTDEITLCDSFYTFFHAIHRDTNPEVVKDAINQNTSSTEPPSVHLSLSIQRGSNTLKIYVGHARNLPLINSISTAPPDSYVKIKIVPDRMRNTKKKSTIIKNTCNPSYSFTAEYNFESEDEMKFSTIDVSIWQCGSPIVRDNYKICGALIPVEQVLSCRADGKAWEPRISPPASQLERLATGTDLYLVCQVSEDEVDSDNVEVSWYKDGTRMTKQKIRKNGFIQASLAFVQPSRADNGDYSCRATTDDETKEEKVTIVFYERAGFINTNPIQHPQEGDNANISCETKGDRLDEIFWQKNGFILTEADERGYRFENDDHNLIIPNFDSEQDDGNYTCNVVQFAQVYKQDISVTAYSRPSISVFHVPEGNYGLEGGHATFKCQATGKPAPTYEWFKHGESGETVELTAGDKYRIEDGLLVINYLTGSDAGDYSCLASNEMGNATQAAKLSIHRRPKIDRIEDVVTELGNDVEIVCTIDSESDISDAYFLFNKQKYAPEEVPTPDSPDTEDASEEGNNEDSNEEVEESAEEATTTEETETTEEPEGDNEESENEESRKRRSTVDETIVVEWRDKNLVLKIKNVQMSHMGKYSCHAENMAGTSHENAKVLIRHPPVFTNVSERYIRRKIGDDAKIYCHISAVPPAVLKIDQDGSKVYPDGANVQLDQTNDKIHLTFHSLRESDFGTYHCTAKNSEGTAEPAVFELIKIEYPKDPETIVCTKEIYPNYAICELSGYGTNRGEWPTHFEVHYIESKFEPTEDLDWDSESTVTEGVFDEGSIRIDGLSTSTNYYARFRAVNEAGRGELSPIIHFETTSAWSPEAVTDVEINCPDVCSVNWTAPNDRGSEITGYKLIFTEIETKDEEEIEVVVTAPAEEGQESGENAEAEQSEDTVDTEGAEETEQTEESQESGEASDENEADNIIIEVGADDLHVDLPQLLPLRDYKLSIVAINDEGESKPSEYFFRTTEHSGLATLFPLPNWFVICIVITIAFFIALCIDAFCCKTRQCGILACVTAHIRNRRNRIPKDIEQGTGSAENRGLLSEKPHTKN